MRRSFLARLCAVSLLLLILVQPSRPTATPPKLHDSVLADWNERAAWLPFQQMLNEQAWVENWQPEKPKPAKKQTRQRSVTGGGDVAVSYEPGSIEAIVCSVFGDNCARALRVARCESHLNPAARNPSGASGLFQIMMPLHADLFNRPDDVFDPLENSRAAFSLSSGGTNWRAWTCKA